jgi:hypothetical protein
MRNVLRTPITWLVMAELIVVGALVVLAWDALAGAIRPVLASPALQPPDSSSPADTPLPDLAASTKAPAGPLPGLNVDSAFWRGRLAQLNQDQVYLERLEWQIVHSAVGAMERYVEAVVVPAVQRAERGNGSG